MMMDRSMAHDGATRRDVFKAHVGRIIARMLEYAGVLWAAGCVGSAALEFAIDPRWSDALSDAFPLVLAGGLGILCRLVDGFRCKASRDEHVPTTAMANDERAAHIETQV